MLTPGLGRDVYPKLLEMVYNSGKILVGSYDDGNDTVQKRNKVRLAKQQLCTCITLFCTFLCRAPTWYDQSLSRLENGNDKAINLASKRGPSSSVPKKKTSLNLISFFQVTVLLGIRRKTFGRCKVDFSATCPLASPSSDREVSINIKAYPICNAYRVTHPPS